MRSVEGVLILMNIREDSPRVFAKLVVVGREERKKRREVDVLLQKFTLF